MNTYYNINNGFFFDAHICNVLMLAFVIMFFKMYLLLKSIYEVCTVCPRSLDPFYIVTQYTYIWSRLPGHIVLQVQ